MTDAEIDAAIAAEERDLLQQIGEEPGYLAQATSIFGGSLGWTNAVLMAAQTILFVAGAYAAWQFFAAADMLTALRWGLPSATLILAATILKAALLPVIHIQRVLRAVNRIAVLSAGRGRH
jgi:hypothetical protein